MTPTSPKKNFSPPPLLIRPLSRRLKSDSSSPTGVLQRSLHAYQEEGKWEREREEEKEAISSIFDRRRRLSLLFLLRPLHTRPRKSHPTHPPQFPPGAPRAFPESDPACLKNMAMEGRRGRKPFSRSTFGKRGGGDCPFRKAHISRTPFSSFQPPRKKLPSKFVRSQGQIRRHEFPYRQIKERIERTLFPPLSPGVWTHSRGEK